MNADSDKPATNAEPKPASSPHLPDAWLDGAAYEQYVGRWSLLVAREFLSWLEVPPGRRWLDVGCGTGALAQTIAQIAEPAAVLGIDRTPGYVAYATQQVHDARVQFQVGDAVALPVDDGAFDAVVSGLMLNFLPDPGVALREMIRAVRTGSIVAAYVWDYAGEMQLMRHFWDTAVALNPEAKGLDEGLRFPLCRPQPLEELFRNNGLHDVSVRNIDVPTDFRDFDDLWSPFLGGNGPAPTYVMSLGEPQRTALRDELQRALSIAQDGSISLVARAWAVRGTPAPVQLDPQ
jgi:SAM-dependent methyltransferase